MSIGVSVVLGIPGGASAQIGVNYSFKSQDLVIFGGVTFAMYTAYTAYSFKSGWNIGITVGASIYSGLPVSTNFLTIGINYNFKSDDLSSNLSAWTIGTDGVHFNPSVSVSIFVNRTTNWVRGKGFKNNDQVLKDFVEKKQYQDALNYWGFDGKYDPNNKLFEKSIGDAITDPKTGNIYYGDAPFKKNYDYLAYIASHEQTHQLHIRNHTNEFYELEEYNTYMSEYKKQGLHPKHGDKIENKINSYGLQSGTYSTTIMSNGTYLPPQFFNPPWYNFIYKIPRFY